MSILDLPRIHFCGIAKMRVPTGNKNNHGAVDLETNDVYQNGEQIDLSKPVTDYHEYLFEVGPRYNERGEWDEQGPFSLAMGWDFAGNNHFVWDAQVVSTQRQFDEVDIEDPVVGSQVELWGHHNEYLGTTFNRARMVECDPTSNWTTQVMVGQLTFGRRGPSHEVPNLFSAVIDCTQHARWQRFDHIRELRPNCNNFDFGRAAVYQFTVSKESREFLWGPDSETSATVTALRKAMADTEVYGLVIQYALFNMSAPVVPNAPVFTELVGSIGLWRGGEMRTYPSGRLLTPRVPLRDGVDVSLPLANLGVQIGENHASLNMVVTVPRVGRASAPGPGPTPQLGPMLEVGDLELRTSRTNRLIARIPRGAYEKDAYLRTSGIVDVPLEQAGGGQQTASQEGLCIVDTRPGGEQAVLLQEQELNVQVDDANVYLEFPNRRKDDDHAVAIELRTFLRGRPVGAEAIYFRQFYNPRGFPQLRYAFERDPANCGKDFAFPGNEGLFLVLFKPGKLDDAGEFGPRCTITTDENGRAWVTIRGNKAGATRILMSANPDLAPLSDAGGDEASVNYDNADRLRFWAAVGSFSVRVLPDDWALEDVDIDQVDFDCLYKHVLAYYELIYSFMREEVFSLEDRCKAETYARLMWQMCDPCNKDKTYYMPPTRELSHPKAMLFLKYLRHVQRVGYVPSVKSLPKAPQRQLSTREELVRALRDAVELELAAMAQYTYAAFSIPNYTTGAEYVRQDLWTDKQLHLLCGDGAEVRDFGFRGVLLEVAHEEMLHFLLANNLLMAIGEPFHAASPPISKMNHLYPVDVEFALEPFCASALQRFIRFEWPDFFERELYGDYTAGRDASSDAAHGYGSINELYRQIRQAFEAMPELIVVEKGRVGGEHHLFLREQINREHPDYQLQIDDLESAFFAIDYIAEQSEGGNPDSPHFEDSHFQRFRTMAQKLSDVQGAAFSGDSSKPPWKPAYPALRNPTLHRRDFHANLVTAPDARQVMAIFDECYFLMMQLMVQHFGLTPTGTFRRSKLMNASIDVMTGMLRPLGELLITLPSGKRGRTAGPSFELHDTPTYIAVPRVAYRTIARRFEELRKRACSCAPVSDAVRDLFAFYIDFFDEMADSTPPPEGAQIV